MSNKFPTIPTNILSDLCTRFVMNVPDVESQDVIRIFFQVELAHWFFLDFYCHEDPRIKPCTLKEFCSIIVNYCPTLSRFSEDFEDLYESWKNYKQAVPTYGAILLDPTFQYCLMVQGYWLKSSWSFAKGKVNQDEAPISCAIREVQEETGYSIEGKINPDNFIEKRLNEQICRLYVVHGIPMETVFKAQTRSEIKGISWFDVDLLPSHKKDLVCRNAYQLNPNLFFTAIPFIKDLRIRIQQMKSQHFNYPSYPSSTPPSLPPPPPSPPFLTTLSCNNVTNLTNKPKSKTQAEFFESLLKNSAKKNGDTIDSAQTTHHQPPSPHPPPTPPFFPTLNQSTHSSIPFSSLPSTTLYSANKTSKRNSTNIIPQQNLSKHRLASHNIKSLQVENALDTMQGLDTSPKDNTANEEAFGDLKLPEFSFESPLWNSFDINVQSVLSAIFES